MANWTASQVIDSSNAAYSTGGARDVDRVSFTPHSTTKARYHLMRAVDADASPLTYRTWVVMGSPDTTGAKYTGTKSGLSPLSNIVVVTSWLA